MVVLGLFDLGQDSRETDWGWNPQLQAGDGFDLGEGELAVAELEEELGADGGEGFGDDGECALEWDVLSDELEDDGLADDDAVAGFDLLFLCVELFPPFAEACPVVGLVEVEFALVEVHDVRSFKS